MSGAVVTKPSVYELDESYDMTKFLAVQRFTSPHSEWYSSVFFV